MKKVLASVTVAVYLVFASGLMVNYHYCMDRYDSFSLYMPVSNSCSKMNGKKHSCCHDDVKIFKIRDNHKTSLLVFYPKKFRCANAETTRPVSAILSQNTLTNNTDHSPPGFSQNIYISNCVLRI